jgi:thiamine biosynthesis lipoprotein
VRQLRGEVWLAALALVSTVVGADTPVALAGRAMGTTWTVKFVQPAVPLDAARVEQRIVVRLEQLEELFSTYRTSSAVSQFNAARHTDWIPVAPELARVALRAREIAGLTGGAFDPTVAPLVALWGFGPHRSAVVPPSEAAIVAARQRVDWRRLEIRTEPPALRKAAPDVAVDFSSVAKGFAADEIGELLAALGATNHLVQLGGDVKSAGAGANGHGWRMGVENPREDRRAVACVVALNGHALSTSGDARNFRTGADGRRYGHIIDPRTGWPAAGALASVSVIHASCAASSALATGLFVLGVDDGHALAVRRGLACLLLVRDGDGIAHRATPEFARLATETGRR